MNKCFKCLFYEVMSTGRSGEYPWGYCHRFPPSESQDEGFNLFPSVRAESFCGEFKPSERSNDE